MNFNEFVKSKYVDASRVVRIYLRMSICCNLESLDDRPFAIVSFSYAKCYGGTNRYSREVGSLSLQ